MQNITYQDFLRTLDEVSDLEKIRSKSVSNDEALKSITTRLDETFKTKVAPIVGTLEINLTKELGKSKTM